jgi:hypothetical protein
VVAAILAAYGSGHLPAILPSRTGAPSAPSAAARVAPSAEVIADAVQGGGLPVEDLVIDTPGTDPGHALGRPGQYISAAAWSDGGDPGRSGTIRLETFASAADVARRMAAVEQARTTSPALCEQDLTEGLTLLRISCRVPPAEATAYAVAVRQQVLGRG